MTVVEITKNYMKSLKTKSGIYNLITPFGYAFLKDLLKVVLLRFQT